VADSILCPLCGGRHEVMSTPLGVDVVSCPRVAPPAWYVITGARPAPVYVRPPFIDGVSQPECVNCGRLPCQHRGGYMDRPGNMECPC